MDKYNRVDHEFRPDYVVPPGETVAEMLQYNNMTQAELAGRMGRPKKTINEIIKGKAAITPDTAQQLEHVFGVPASFWSNLDANYRLALARTEELKRLEAQSDWLKTFPLAAMAKLGWIERRQNKGEQVREVLDYFGVATIEAWDAIWITPQAAFRKSSVFASSPGSVAAWLRKGELTALAIQCQPFDAMKFKQVTVECRRLTGEPPEMFCPALQNLCATCGVAVAFVPELPKSRVSGAARWLTADKALIQLSLRYRTDDHLWFSFFHEAGHIVNHGKRSVFLEGDGMDDHLEREANVFAEDALIPRPEWRKFVASGDFSELSIAQFAQDVGIASGIVVGRLQHDGLISFRGLNHLKRHFTWST